MSSSRSIEIDFDVYQVIVANQRNFGEQPNAVLRRLLGLESSDDEVPPPTDAPLEQRHVRLSRGERSQPDHDDPPADGLADKSRGLMVGIAVGNLLGLPYEGRRWNRAAIAAEFPNGIREITSQVGWPDHDDVAQSVVLAEASIGVDNYDIADLALRLWAWAEVNGLGMGGQTARVLRLFGGVEARRELREYVRNRVLPSGKPPREPRGHSATDAARIAWQQRDSAAAGNGAAMRCAPVALRWLHDEIAVVRNSVVSAAVTHWDSRCLWTTVLVNLAIVSCLHGVSVDAPQLLRRAAKSAQLLRDALDPYSIGDSMPPDVQDSAEAALRTGATVDGLDIDHPSAGHTLKTMRAALWCARHPQTFEDGLCAIVSAGGDTDTNGAVAGAVLGARFGHLEIPKRWRDAVREMRDYTPSVPQWMPRERLETLADRVLAHAQATARPDKDRPLPEAGPQSRRRRARGKLRIRTTEIPYENAKDALCKILRHLQQADPSFLKRLSEHPDCIGRSRRTLARRPEDLYPNRPDLQADQCASIADGWFLGTNTSTPQKLVTLRAAAEVAGLKYDEDLVVDL